MVMNLVKPGSYPVIQWEDDDSRPPAWGSSAIHFNGRGGDGHDTFFMLFNEMDGMRFCKTARKPYDLWVVATLCLVDFHMPDCFEIRSDGTADNWEPGLALAQNIQPTARLPTSL
jgi:hypothetical protein